MAYCWPNIFYAGPTLAHHIAIMSSIIQSDVLFTFFLFPDEAHNFRLSDIQWYLILKRNVINNACNSYVFLPACWAERMLGIFTVSVEDNVYVFIH